MYISFGYKSQVKSIAQHCAYTGAKFTKANKATFEHIVPHSVGGANSTENCLAVTQEINGLRGNIPFYKWLNQNPNIVKNIQKYLDELRGVKIEGIDYVEVVKKTLNKAARGVAVFKQQALQELEAENGLY